MFYSKKMLRDWLMRDLHTQPISRSETSLVAVSVAAILNPLQELHKKVKETLIRSVHLTEENKMEPAGRSGRELVEF